ncbi:hypothetical protein HMPREF3153_09695 [Corynebacterium sp. HMSC06C06]|uniref:Uncharacterized protein n=1 Tax=Corynebacterium striatum TaxID=43770 RepID=A0ABX7DFA1_CORST|nr:MULTISPECIES: hypothetical protein [Corynebacterium]OFT50490.1 hypothetical protein HMPREF3153_09695 [Corynebacterium sp. HMSC06C06]QQU76455.1 hypothetical protein I6I72_10115 [Corynebacterium striatum]HCD1553126.1 hypothetical protein [Corynebacterium striatum]HCD1826163.1 hypothetical protein [Corynebacterium striatum]HCD2182109.1 hypothetical protein [Corynebacterium striatum]
MTNALFNITSAPREPGRHEQALDDTLAAARDAQLVDDIDDALISIARANAWALDAAEAEGKPYAVAQVSGPYREVLESLRLTPADRKADANDELNRALAELRESNL